MDSEGEDFYDDDAELLDDEEAEDENPLLFEADEKKEQGLKRAYRVVKEDEIRQVQQNLISEVCSVLGVSRSAACTLLSENNWTLSSDQYEEWFSKSSDPEDQQQVITRRKRKKPRQLSVCNICFETKQKQQMLSAGISYACGHLFCVECWTTYISISIKDGPGCLKLPCPEPGCDSQAGINMVDSLASDSDKDRYYHYLYRSYIESNPRKIKYCPSPGCDYAIVFEGGGLGYEVVCDCGHKLCWNCGEESHSPLDCSTVSKWMEKNCSEAENTKWILVYTKPCPKCRKPIEKNQGCNHMKCRPPCSYRFCWVCLGSLVNHNCNEYKAAEDKTSRENARKDLAKYTHYYERWENNDKARKRALEDLETARDKHVLKLSETQDECVTQLECVVDAWDQIVECRRVLKWTYAYGYYLSESESNKLDFFGYLQGEAENALEKLHHWTEKEMLKYLNARAPLEGFKDFRRKLVDLTVVNNNYFGNLVRALENNLSEVRI